ncbi:rhomboid family intramembrane serine protease [Roseimaritima ulvae]|uniref:Rhomboid protease GlpG n=1 Tax=Roseimaritima ulvae TaxID=980254 RepID=A0A5B9QVG8_9BACT|nr:rhomboid family intramembrane serine protease [Roseimaritima ulvae]QEG41375.1 Rhomboid protease GlpG [Roseimaritima ulvae]
MRKFGTLSDESTANRLIDYLLTQQIHATANAADDPAEGWELWVREEDQLPKARQILAQYQASPEASQYVAAAAEAKQIRKQNEAAAKQRAKLVRKMPRSNLMDIRSRPIPFTIAVIVIASIAGLITNFGNPPSDGLRYEENANGTIEVPEQSFGLALFRNMMMIDPLAYEYGNQRAGNRDPLDRIRRGEVWRLITPAFLHGSIMHLAFNMLMMYSLGGILERLHGTVFLILLFLITGVVATLAQAYTPAALGGSPLQLGASGVIFGLFGYLWVRPMLQPSFPVRIPQSSVVIILGWGLLCMTPIIPNVANAAHVGGLVAGIAVVPLAIRLWPFP